MFAVKRGFLLIGGGLLLFASLILTSCARTIRYVKVATIRNAIGHGSAAGAC
jgi:hypothetical protein